MLYLFVPLVLDSFAFHYYAAEALPSSGVYGLDMSSGMSLSPSPYPYLSAAKLTRTNSAGGSTYAPYA